MQLGLGNIFFLISLIPHMLYLTAEYLKKINFFVSFTRGVQGKWILKRTERTIIRPANNENPTFSNKF